MKSLPIVACILGLLLVAGCASKPAPSPGIAVDRGPRTPAPISEQRLDPTPSPGEIAKTGPAPLAEPVLRPRDPGPAADDQTAMMPVNYVNDRIFEYGRKLERWKELDNQTVVARIDPDHSQTMVRCFRDLQQVLNGYQTVRDTLLQRNVIGAPPTLGRDEVLDLQRQDIAFLEGVCGRLLGDVHDRDAGWQQRPPDADLNQLETLIERYSVNGEYDEVIQVWRDIPEHQRDRVALKTKILYGNALMFLDQPEPAALVYRQMVDAMSVSTEQPTDVLSLRKVLADLYTAYGNFPAAEQQYRQIAQDYRAIGAIEEWANLQLSILERSATGSPELSEYAGLLRNYLGYLPQRDGYSVVWQADTFLSRYPYSAVSSNVDTLKTEVQRRADAWFGDYLTRADALAAENKFQDAMELLQKIDEPTVGPERFQAVQEKLDSLVLSEAVERETMKIQQMQELQRRWNEGMLLADGDDLDAAIAVFTDLLDSEFGSRAEEKINELSLKAAMNERRNAADLFVRFTKTTDPESKKRLLIESRKVLKDILVKYPGIEIADKVVGNITRVEQEMNALDPLLLPAIEAEERRQAQQQPDATAPLPAGVDIFDLPR